MTRSELIQELHSAVYNERRNYRKFGDNTRKNITLDTYLSERIADFILSRERLILEKIGKLTNAISAIQMLIEEDIEERKGFTFNRKKMLDIAEEALK